MTYRVLCAYDASPSAQKAFEHALELARRFDGELHVVAVFEPAEASRGVKSETVAQQARAQFSDAFADLQSRAAAGGLALQATVSVGTPAQQILKRAEELKADHVVVGQRGRDGRNTVGSVSLRLVSHGVGTITVVR